MPGPEIPTLSRGVVLRGVGFGVAVVLGAVAVWLIVTSDSLKWHDLGVLCGLWGLLIGAIAVGSRRGSSTEHHADGDSGNADDGKPGPGVGLEVRSTRTQVEHAQEVAARRAHEARIEQMLRQEIRAAVNREVGTLRAEIAQLRTDLLEKVGGQLRLEHIETTRVIGSDLEALQEEIRALKTVSRDTPFPASTVRDLGRVHLRPAEGAAPVQPARSSAASATPDRPDRREARVGRIVEVESSIVKTAVVDAATVATEPTRAKATHRPDDAMTGPIRRSDQTDPIAAHGGSGQPAPQRSAPAARSGQPVSNGHQGSAARSASPTQDRPAPPQSRSPGDVPASAASPAGPRSSGMAADVFAGLPRLSRFVDDAPDGAPSRSATPTRSVKPAGPVSPAAPMRPAVVAPESQAEPPDRVSYHGRRRRLEQEEQADSSAGPGLPRGQHSPSGRRHRDDDPGQDLLARLLERERH